MRNLFPFFLLFVGFISLQRHELNAQTGIPRILSIQGMLTSSFGSKPITGKQLFRVGIYESPLGGLPLHEQIDTVHVGESGLYQFSLGGMKGLPRTVKFDKSYFIDISVNGEKQNMRIPLQSAAYAFMAGAVENDVVGVEQLNPTLRDRLFPDQKNNEEKTLANYVSGFRAVIAGGDENRTSANYASILGGFTNSVNGSYGTVGGGQSNMVSGSWAFVGGGQNNRAQAFWSTITAGIDNIVTTSGNYSTIAGGQTNQIGALHGSIGGGQSNSVSAQSGTVSGGQNNRAMQTYATVSGGQKNQSAGTGSSIGGGIGNIASAQNARVGGGASNTGSGISSFIGGGSSNVASGMASFVGGGSSNAASAQGSGIAFGQNNIASASFATVSGGNTNRSTALNTTISGGEDNEANAQNSTVSGGLNNRVFSSGSSISGGSMNTIWNMGMMSNISGGEYNHIDSRYALISGGLRNQIAKNSNGSVVSGGDSNIIETIGSSVSSTSSVIAGGNNNRVRNSNFSIIGGGRHNTLSGGANFSTIGGGDVNSLNGLYGTISGGGNNTISSSAQYATITGGRGNTVSASYGSASGQSNSVSASNGVAIGQSNSVSSTNGVALGTSNSVSSSNGVALGTFNSLSSTNAVAIGESNSVSSSNGVALGTSNSVSSSNGVALGTSNSVSSSNAVALGTSNSVSSSNGIALGNSNTVNGSNGMAIGNSANAGSNQLYSKFTAGHVFEGQGTAIGNHVAQFYNPTPGGNGIEIKIANPIPAMSNYFVTFENASGGRVGRITGQTLAEMHASNSYKAEKRKLEKDREQKILKAVTSGLALANKTKKAVQSGVEVISGPPQIASATASTAATLGAGAGWTSNTVLKTVFKLVTAGIDITDAMIAGYQEGQAIAEAALAKEKIQHWIQKQDEQIGVTYESGSADYAEWLPKQEATIDFAESSVVGIHKGKIRYETEGAEQLMVVSSRPMILGNMPANGMEHEFEAVAFMGQVPVSILGTVTKGDFILPSGGNNGLGIAVHPEDMRNEDFGNIVGIAWSDAPDTFAINKVNVAVGLQTTTLANQISKQSKEIAELKKAVRMIHETLIAMSDNQSKTASISENQDKIFYQANDQSIFDSKPSLNEETNIPVHEMHKECLLKYDTMISSNAIPTLQTNSSILNALGNDPILKELYLYSMIQRLRN